MSILQARLQELGRIRIGDQVPLKGKQGTRPRRLETFRLTSTNKPRLEAAARIKEIGGEVSEWIDAPGGKQWQLYTNTDVLHVTVPPFAAISQTNEIWAAGECRVRCDGENIIFSTKEESIGKPCACASMPIAERVEKAKEGKACHTITRLNLILPDVPGFGVWRFETSSYYAGMELQGAAELIQAASAEGVYIECALQIETRRVRRRDQSGQPQTQVFPVVTLQPLVTVRQLMARQIPDDRLIGAPATAQNVIESGREAAALLYGGKAEEYGPAEEPALDDIPDENIAIPGALLDWRPELQEVLHALGNKLQPVIGKLKGDEQPEEPYKSAQALLLEARTVLEDADAREETGRSYLNAALDTLEQLK